MATIVNMHEAKTHLSRLAEHVRAGEEIILANAGTPWIRLMPLDDAPTPARKPGRWPELRNMPDSVWFDPLTDDRLAAFEGAYSNIL